jgi:hypothetical protein
MLMELTPSYDFFLTIILKLFVAFLDEPSFGHTSLYCLMCILLQGKYLLFTMILVTLSICVTVGVLNISSVKECLCHGLSTFLAELVVFDIGKVEISQHYLTRLRTEKSKYYKYNSRHAGPS